MTSKLLSPILGIASLLVASSLFAQTTPSPEPPALTPLMLADAPAATTPPAAAPVMTPFDDNAWHLSLGIPVWIPAIKGDLIIHGRSVSPDQDTGDTVDLLKERLNGAFSMHLEARKNRFSLFADVMYLDVRAQGTHERTDAEAFLKGLIGEAGLSYTIIAPEKTGFGAFRLDAMGGVRLTGLRLGIDANSDLTFVNKTLYDPFVGLRMELGLTEWLSLKARADIGGFGIDAFPTSDFSYNIDAGLEFHIASWFDLDLGYRWLKYEFVRDPNFAEFDATLRGPYVALKFNF